MALVNCTIEVKNETLFSFMHCQSTPELWIFAKWFLCTVMIIGVIVGLPVNLIALWIFYFRMKCWKPHTLFLFNLIIADFLLLISVPFRIETDLRGDNWVFGRTWCHINLFMLSANRSASIAFMTVVALDRYFKVVHPHHRISRMTLTQSGWLTGLLWIVVIALQIPMMTTDLYYKKDNVSLCRSFNSYTEAGIPLGRKVHYTVFVAEFILPWFWLLFCSARIACHLHKRQMDKQKRVRKAIRVVGVISLVFTICFMPSVLTGLVALFIKHFHPQNLNLYNLFIHLFMICIGFTYLNSALDPFIYSFSSSMFCDAIRSFISHLGFVKNNALTACSRADNS